MTTSTTSARPGITTGAAKSFTRAWRGSILDANRRVLDFQKRAFDTTFDMVTRVQERREEAIVNWAEKSERLPAEARSLVQEWTRLFQDSRSSYRAAVDASFGLANSYLDSLAPQATEES